jgi:hypothetical protein
MALVNTGAYSGPISGPSAWGDRKLPSPAYQSILSTHFGRIGRLNCDGVLSPGRSHFPFWQLNLTVNINTAAYFDIYFLSVDFRIAVSRYL